MSNPLRLFMLRNNRTGKPVLNCGTPWYFRSKTMAKRHRDDLNAEAGNNDIVVAVGPDHWRYTPASASDTTHNHVES